VGRERLACGRGQKIGGKALSLPEQKAARVIKLAVLERD